MKQAKARGVMAPGVKVLVAVYHGTDCCNNVFDYATLHHARQKIAASLVRRGLLIARGQVMNVDGDGFMAQPERYGTGYRLTNAGYEVLTSESPQRFPAQAEYRRFYVTPKPARRSRK